MGEFGRKRFLECLSWEHSKQKLIEFYDRLLQVETSVPTPNSSDVEVRS
jgi:hypothetical protein